MSNESARDAGIVLYLCGVCGLSALTIGLLAVLFLTRVPEFTEAVVANPITAAQEFPIAVALLLGTIASTILLIGLIVGFGARYGVPEPEESPQRK